MRLLGADELKPGEEGWLQLELREPVVALRGDRYILRRPSPSETLGGGAVVDPQPKRHRRFDPEAIWRGWKRCCAVRPTEVLTAAFQALGIIPIQAAVARSRLGPEAAAAALDELLHSECAGGSRSRRGPAAGRPAGGTVRRLAGGESERARREVENYHRTNPLRRGMPREELKEPLEDGGPAVQRRTALLVAARYARRDRGAGSPARTHDSLQFAAAGRLGRFAWPGLPPRLFAPPSVKEAQAETGEDVYQALLDQGTLIQVSADVAFRKQDYDEMLREVRQHFTREATLTVAQFRDRFQTSRKYALGFLEHMDASGITARDGDFRRLRK